MSTNHDPLREFTTRRTPQTEPTSAAQVRNNAGGYVFQVSDLELLRRFLLLGSTGGTYYVSERNLTRDNAQHVIKMCEGGQARLVVDEVVSISDAGRAPRQQPGLFALAIAASISPNVEDRRYAFSKLSAVARTGYTLFTFVQYMQQLRGWGRLAKRSVAQWYMRDVGRLAYQVVKYRQREGWTHRDVLRLSHPKPSKSSDDGVTRRALFDWICGRSENFDRAGLSTDDPLAIVDGYERVQRAQSALEVADLIRDYRLPWETLPDRFMNERLVWEALLENGVPQTALIRQLPRLTRMGLLTTAGGWTNEVVHLLTSPELLIRGRIHPMTMLVAQRTYARGASERGSSTWTPSRRIVDALDQGFYSAFETIEPTNQRFMLALDVSGSMGSQVAGMPLSAREVSAAMAMVTVNVEPNCEVVAFTANRGRATPRYTWADVRRNSAVTPLTISPRQRLDDVVQSVTDLPFGYTDCALPIVYATKNNLEVDAFVIYTDNESYAGPIHVHQALRDYRERTGIPARLIVVAMTATSYSVADPNDPLSLDVVGFDTSTPNVISAFAGD